MVMLRTFRNYRNAWPLRTPDIRWTSLLLCVVTLFLLLSPWNPPSVHKADSDSQEREASSGGQKGNQVLQDCPPPTPSKVDTMALLKEGKGSASADLPAALRPGGWYQVDQCRPLHRVAILLPYRNREEQLDVFLTVMHPFLSQQTVEYRIFVIEQAGDDPFNRAKLLNVGYKEASNLGTFDCFIFHDVDLIPEDGRNIYDCPGKNPRHMSVSVSTMGYKLQYKNLVGGVCALTKQQIEDANGFSNLYWGWGSEDNDMFRRLQYFGYKVERRQPEVARYFMLSHDKAKPSNTRFDLFSKWRKRIQTDGLTSLNYKRLSLELRPSYTWILADLLWDQETKPR